MHPVYEESREEHEFTFTADEIVDEVETEIPLPQELVWDYVNQSEFRNVLIGSDRQEIEGRKNGRVSVGSSYQCYHGNSVITQVVVEWRPLERVVLQMLLPFPGRESYVRFDFRLTPTESGTLLSSTLGRLTGPHIKRWLAGIMFRARRRHTQQEMEISGTEYSRTTPPGRAGLNSKRFPMPLSRTPQPPPSKLPGKHRKKTDETQGTQAGWNQHSQHPCSGGGARCSSSVRRPQTGGP